MNLTLKRNQYRIDGVFGGLETTDEGDQIAVTLERAYPNGDGTFSPKIPPGVYTCVKGTHNLLSGGPFETFEITGVPGHTGLLFHQGNFDSDSTGCVLLGREVLNVTPKTQMVSDSRETFHAFMGLQSEADSFTLTVLS